MRMSEATIRAQWKKGQSGNPKGRPKTPQCLEEQSDMVTRIVRMLLDQPCHVMGTDSTETLLTRFLRDMVASADLGDAGCRRYLVNIALRGDRDRLQALRAARKAKTPRNRRFEEYVADLIAQPPPTLRQDQQHLILPGREVRTEHLKPKPRRKYNPEPELYNKKGEINPWYLEKAEPDPLVHLPKHLPKDEVRANIKTQLDQLFRNAYGPDASAPPQLGDPDFVYPERKAEIAPAPEANTKTAPRMDEKTDPKTGPIRGLGRGLVTGLRNALLSQQPIDAPFEFPIHVNDVKKFVAKPKPNGINGTHVNGHNGSHAQR
jgi:Family of unknown function (DUF5681)